MAILFAREKLGPSEADAGMQAPVTGTQPESALTSMIGRKALRAWSAWFIPGRKATPAGLAMRPSNAMTPRLRSVIKRAMRCLSTFTLSLPWKSRVHPNPHGQIGARVARGKQNTRPSLCQVQRGAFDLRH